MSWNNTKRAKVYGGKQVHTQRLLCKPKYLTRQERGTRRMQRCKNNKTWNSAEENTSETNTMIGSL